MLLKWKYVNETDIDSAKKCARKKFMNCKSHKQNPYDLAIRESERESEDKNILINFDEWFATVGTLQHFLSTLDISHSQTKPEILYLPTFSSHVMCMVYNDMRTQT